MAVMRLGPVVLYFGDAPPLAANEITAEHMPEDMIEAMGRPRIVHSGQEILEVIKHA